MKHPTFTKTVIAITVAAVILITAMLSVGAAETETQPLPAESLTPEIETAASETPIDSISDGTTPISQAALIERFTHLTHVTEENGSFTATIFSEEQIADYNARRAAGEWMDLTADEILFLISDTAMLFETYDRVQVRDLNGTIHSYRGKSFYTSEEYYNSFGIVEGEVTDSYNIHADLCDAIYQRLKVMHPTMIDDLTPGTYTSKKVFFVGIPGPDPTINLINAGWKGEFYYELDYHDTVQVDKWRRELQAYPFGAFYYDRHHSRISYIPDLSTGDLSSVTTVCSSSLFFPDMGADKYDATGSVVVLEVWQNATEALKATLRLDDRNNPEEIAKIISLWSDTKDNLGGVSHKELDQDAEYRVVIYFNNAGGFFETRDIAINYHADGKLNQFSFTDGTPYTIFTPNGLSGCENLAIYINNLLKSTFQAQS